MSVAVTPGMIVEAISSRGGFVPTLVESVNGDSFKGLALHPRVDGTVTGSCEHLLDEIIEVTNERALAIRSADVDNVGVFIVHNDDGISLYHLDNGDFISRAKTFAGALKITSRTLSTYANDGAHEGENWSRTSDQADALLAQSDMWLRLMENILSR